MLKRLRHIDDYLSSRPHRLIIGISTVVLLAITFLHDVSGPEISFSIFYLLPILLATWYAGRMPGLVMSVLATLFWLVAELASGHVYSHPGIPLWNSLARLMFLLTFTYMLSYIKGRLEFEAELAGTDPLTGLKNRRAFYQQCSSELERANRYAQPLSLAYFDLDNFKQVNDTFGHEEGDELLRTVSKAMRRYVRKNDSVARLGGDEFAVLFPMADYLTAEEAMRKIHQILDLKMLENGWPVTFSIGLLTVRDGTGNLEDLLREADRLMYRVKKRSKNSLIHTTWPQSMEHV